MGKEKEPVFPTVDVVIQYKTSVLLVKRRDCGKLALPGGHLEQGETFLQAAVREAREEIGLEINSKGLTFVCVLDAPNRDPRPGRRISLVYRVAANSRLVPTAGSDAETAAWYSIMRLKETELAFDHWKVIALLRQEMRTPEKSNLLMPNMSSTRTLYVWKKNARRDRVLCRLETCR